MRRFKALLLILPMMLMLNTCVAPAYAFTDETEGAPPTEAQPVETMPVETVPTETPPTETPPVETPPVETPPVETQPVETILPAETWSQLLELLLEGTSMPDQESQPQGCGNCTCGGGSHTCDCCTCGDHAQTCECFLSCSITIVSSRSRPSSLCLTVMPQAPISTSFAV